MNTFPDLAPAVPEIFLAVSAMGLLLLSVSGGDRRMPLVCWLAVLALTVTGVLVVTSPSDNAITFSGMFVADGFSVFIDVLILIGGALTLVMSPQYLKRENAPRGEFPVLIVLATLGMLMMVAAGDFLSLYVGLELQSLALYVLAAFRRDSIRSTEAGLKYFVLGALASGILLYGSTLVYGFTGSTNFTAIANSIAANEAGPPLGVIFGMAFIAAGLAFKVAAVPFHMWTPDVYEGSPTAVTAFFSVAPKIAAVALLTRVMMAPFAGLAGDWSQIMMVLAVASMVLGAFAAIGQRNIKRLMAYSSIANVGYVLMGIAAGTVSGVRGVLVYLAIYLAMSIGAWAVILTMRRGAGLVKDIGDLSGLARRQPLMAAAMAIFLFSLAGIPPLAGFFGKFYVFLAAIDAGMYTVAIIGVLATVVGTYYYLRVVKIMYFDEPAAAFETPPRAASAVAFVTALFTLLFFAFPAPIVAMAQTAAMALFP